MSGSEYSKSSNFVLFSDCFAFAKSVYFQRNFRGNLSISTENFFWDLKLSNPQVNLGRAIFFTILRLPIHEHSIALLLDSSLASLCSFVIFSIEVLHVFSFDYMYFYLML